MLDLPCEEQQTVDVQTIEPLETEPTVIDVSPGQDTQPPVIEVGVASESTSETGDLIAQR